MNSWFLYKVTVFSMGPISAKIAYYLGKFDQAMSVHGVGEWYDNRAMPMNIMGRLLVSLRASVVGCQVVVCCCCVCVFFASVKLAKREQTGMDRPWRPLSSHGHHAPPLPMRLHATPSLNIFR
jgi:hypothetical protein